MTRLANRAALVTGADSGIGAPIAIEFAREGADVVINYLHDTAGANSIAEQVRTLGRRAIDDPEVRAEQTASIPISGRPNRSRSRGWRCSLPPTTPTTSPAHRT